MDENARLRMLVTAVAMAGVLCTACGGSSSPGPADNEPGSAPSTRAVASATRPLTAPSTSTSQSVTATCIHDDELPSAVHFKAGGETLEGLVVGDGPTGIVLAPQLDEDLCEWKPYAYALSKLGYRVIAYTAGTHTRAGVVAAAGLLRAMGSTHILLVGASKGGTAVLAAAPVIQPRVSAVVDISGPASIDDVDAVSSIGKLTMPTFFVVGKLDVGFAEDTQTLYKRAKASRGRRLLLVPGTQHGVDLVNGSTETAIDAFLRAHAS